MRSFWLKLYRMLSKVILKVKSTPQSWEATHRITAFYKVSVVLQHKFDFAITQCTNLKSKVRNLRKVCKKI